MQEVYVGSSIRREFLNHKIEFRETCVCWTGYFHERGAEALEQGEQEPNEDCCESTYREELREHGESWPRHALITRQSWGKPSHPEHRMFYMFSQILHLRERDSLAFDPFERKVLAIENPTRSKGRTSNKIKDGVKATNPKGVGARDARS